MLLKKGEKFSNLPGVLEALKCLENKIDKWYKRDYFENKNYFDPPLYLDTFASAIVNKSKDDHICSEFYRLLNFSAEQQQYKRKVNLNKSDSRELWRLLLNISDSPRNTELIFKDFIKKCPYGMGTKTASMCLKFIFFTGSYSKRTILAPYIPHLFLPIDRIVYRFLSKKLKLYEIEDPSRSNAYSRRFNYFFHLQDRLKTDCGEIPRITLDHLWNVNQYYCKAYQCKSKAYQCKSCPLKEYCDEKTSYSYKYKSIPATGGNPMVFNKNELLRKFKEKEERKGYAKSSVDTDIRRMNSVLNWCERTGYSPDRQGFAAFIEDQKQKGNKLTTIVAYQETIDRFLKVI